MEIELTSIFIQIKLLREYIVKLGPTRRQGKNFECKINEVRALYNKFKIVISNVDKFSEELTQLIHKIEDIYQNTIKFEHRSTLDAKMESENFSLKTAVSLLPKMNGDEQMTQDLIDAIELYSSMLKDSDRVLLIKFVLSTRLSAAAKMRLCSNYVSVESLLSDMRKHLLTVKSDVAIQAKLARVRQCDRSISSYGAEIEKLMTDLTISQAGENQDAYEILHPLNEKYAIKKFADGLRDHRLGTIITARNLTSLKDAIRVAEDERCTLVGQINTFQRQFKSKPCFGKSGSRGYSHVSHKIRDNFVQRTRSPARTFHRQDNKHVGFYNNNTRGRDVRHNNYRGRLSQQNRRHIACIEQMGHTSGENNSMSSAQCGNAEHVSAGQFFRV
ncbi:uncharacterized protein LOC142986015 [Anticarsia gemmatalis]|uniref:uncharacterized protein LOC142986015 n=1 Tax=Anticarsia gemmatalis TaxID=129554 RepID=UPI003F776412